MVSAISGNARPQGAVNSERQYIVPLIRNEWSASPSGSESAGTRLRSLPGSTSGGRDRSETFGRMGITNPFAVIDETAAIADDRRIRAYAPACAQKGRSGMNVLVVGATGGSGRAVVKELAGRGHTVTAFARRPEALGARGATIRVLAGD